MSRIFRPIYPHLGLIVPTAKGPTRSVINWTGRTTFGTAAGTGKSLFIYYCSRQTAHILSNYYYYYYWYSALGPVWAETRAQSGDWYGSGTLHPGQVLRGSLPLLSPAL